MTCSESTVERRFERRVESVDFAARQTFQRRQIVVPEGHLVAGIVDATELFADVVVLQLVFGRRFPLETERTRRRLPDPIHCRFIHHFCENN